MWIMKPGVDVGLLPMIFLPDDPASAVDQINKRYVHGGGFNEFDGFELHKADSPLGSHLQYPEDPPMRELARTFLPATQEEVVLYMGVWVAIVQKDGSYKVCRMD